MIWYFLFCFLLLKWVGQANMGKTQPDPCIKPITKTFSENPNKLSGEAEVAKA
jgi:hypothetical protein